MAKMLDTDQFSDGATGKVTRRQIVDAAREYLGAPFRHQGRNKNGIDCAGLLVAVAWDLGIESWDPAKHTGYQRIPDGVTVNRIMSALLDKVPPLTENFLPGNVVQIAYHSGGRELVTHMGFLTDLQGGTGLIHAYFPMLKVVEHRFDDSWKKRCTAVFRPRSIVEE